MIDSLLKLMKLQGADALSIVPNDVPILHKGGTPFKLSMPAVPAELAASFASEVVGPEGAPALAKGQALKGIYRGTDGASFFYEAALRKQGVCLTLSLPGTRSASSGANSPQDAPGWPSAAAAPPTLERADPRSEAPSAGGAPIRRAGPAFVRARHPSLVLDQVQPVPSAADVETLSTAPVEAQLDDPALSVLAQALELGASDVFLASDEPPRVRVSGSIQVLRCPPVRQDQILALAGLEPSDGASAALRTKGNVDLAVELEVAGATRRFRVSLFQHHRGLAAALRPIRDRPPTFKELNLPDDLSQLCAYSNGLVLVTGPTGSGKSTTLAALVEHINQSHARHIITLEDPIEFEHSHSQSMIHQREVGRHVESFSDGLRAALRESPDVILLGEMRDLPTIAAALTAAETGHLVLSTLHTGDATSAIDRIIDVFPGHQQTQVRFQLSSVLRAVVTQILVPAARGTKRVPAIERLIVTNGVACQIRDGRTHQLPSLIQAGGADGMVTLERSLASLVSSGRITLATALAYARDVGALNKLVGNA